MRIIEDRQLCSHRPGGCKPVKVMFDTGASHSAIRKAVLDEKFPDAETKSVFAEITMADGRKEEREIPVVDLFVEIEKEKEPILAHMFVMDSLEQEAILGAQEMEANKIKVEMKPAPEPSEVKYIEGKPAGPAFGGMEIRLVGSPSVLRHRKMLALRHGRR